LKIANKLLETRLRTERSIFKFTSRGLGILPDEEFKPSGAEVHPESYWHFKYGVLDASRWVIGLAIAVALISGLLYASIGMPESLPADVEILDATKILNGRDITSAHRKGNDLVAVA